MKRGQSRHSSPVSMEAGRDGLTPPFGRKALILRLLQAVTA